MIAWLDAASEFGSAQEHQAVGNKQLVATNRIFQLSNRQRCRAWANETQAVKSALDELERRRLPGEPDGPAGYA